MEKEEGEVRVVEEGGGGESEEESDGKRQS